MLILRPILNRAVWNFSGHSEESRYPQPIEGERTGGPVDRWARSPRASSHVYHSIDDHTDLCSAISKEAI